jgi:hypothetical protein
MEYYTRAYGVHPIGGTEILFNKKTGKKRGAGFSLPGCGALGPPKFLFSVLCGSQGRVKQKKEEKRNR